MIQFDVSLLIGLSGTQEQIDRATQEFGTY